MPRKSAFPPGPQPEQIKGASQSAALRNPSASRKSQKRGAESLDDLSSTALRAFLIARDAASNASDLFTPSARMAFLAIKECEQELDVIERYIDERTPAAITRVNEVRARQLLTSLKCTTDLERIGDLVMSMALRVQERTEKMPAGDARQLVEMAGILREMLDLVYRGFIHLDLECVRKVLQMDKDIDRICHGLFQKHLTEHAAQSGPSSFQTLLMAQALERAGDHTTNLAEDLYSLIEGRSLRHAPKKRAAT
jgi:phosphate transport system protein